MASYEIQCAGKDLLHVPKIPQILLLSVAAAAAAAGAPSYVGGSLEHAAHASAEHDRLRCRWAPLARQGLHCGLALLRRQAAIQVAVLAEHVLGDEAQQHVLGVDLGRVQAVS